MSIWDRSVDSSIGKFRHRGAAIARFQLIAVIVISASAILWVLGIGLREWLDFRGIILAGTLMPQSTKLTKEEKQNGKRKLLIPSPDIQELMVPITEEEFSTLVGKTIPPSSQPDSKTP
jgi:hypothetical protein